MFRIGEVEIAHPFALAALSGYSSLPMRRISREFGASYAVHEVLLGTSVAHASEWRDRTLHVPEDDHPVGAQMMAAAPGAFAEGAQVLARSGFDVIDVNFGCPVPHVIRKQRGGYWLTQPATALEIIRETLDGAGGKPVTLKLRRGWDHSPESERNVFAIIDGALELGVAGFVVHGRTIKQQYKGASDWDFVRRVKLHVGRLPVFGSGDLLDAAACVRMLEETGVDGVTIARGAIGNPWIFRDCLLLARGEELSPLPSLAEQRRVITRHYEETVAFLGERLADKEICKFAMRYAKLHPRVRKFRRVLAAARNWRDVRELLDEWYDPDRHWPSTRPRDVPPPNPTPA